MTLSGVAYLSCLLPEHQLRPQGPRPEPGLPAGAEMVGPCCRMRGGNGGGKMGLDLRMDF